MTPRRAGRGRLQGRRAASATPAAWCGLLFALVVAAPAAARAAEEPAAIRRLRAIPAEVVSLLLDGRPGGDLEVEVAADAASGASDGARSIEVTIDVPRARLAADAGAAPALEVYLYAIGAAREVRAHLAERHTLTGEPAAAGPAGGAAAPVSGGGADSPIAADRATVHTRLSGLSSSDRIRILVRDERSARFALRELSMASLVAEVARGADRAASSSPDAAAGGGRRDRDAAREGARSDRDRRPPPSPADVERQRGRAKLLARAYEEVLRSYAAGAGERAVADLRRLEVGALADAAKDHADLLAALREGQNTVAERLAEREPDSLVPLLLLHLEVHDLHLENRDLRLASHTRDRVSAVAELYARTGRSETAARLASDALTAIGSYLQGANALTSGRKLLARAVELDPRNLEARLCIALGHESHGEYPEALRALDELAKYGGADDEVRLRRATTLGRLGRVDEAVALYESLIAGSAQTWVVTLAYQELARIHLARDRPAAAVVALERGARRFPRDPTILLQLSFALERRGASDRALRILERVDRVRVDTGPESPARTRYQRGLDLVGGRSELLDRSGLALLPMLAGTLDSFHGGGGVGRS